MRAIILRPALSALVLALMAAPGCSSSALQSTALPTRWRDRDTFAADPDPELIRAAVPFSLKLVESLLAECPTIAGCC